MKSMIGYVERKYSVGITRRNEECLEKPKSSNGMDPVN